MGKLTAAGLASLPAGRHGDGDGLALQVQLVKGGALGRSWIFRFTSPENGKSRMLGLGEYPLVGLAAARQAAAGMHRMVRSGIDPIEARQRDREAKAVRRHTFREAAESYVEAHAAGWKNAKHAAQWSSTLARWVYPLLGDRDVGIITAEDVLACLTQSYRGRKADAAGTLWTAAAETGARVRGRIETVVDYARARGWCDGANPAVWRGGLAMALPARNKIAPVQHHAALPYAAVPGFMAKLAAMSGTAPLALRFAVLTAARTGEVLGATWAEISRETATWTVPGERMKAGREHRVPLADAALAVLDEAWERRDGDGPGSFVFPGAKRGAPLSNMSLTMLMRRHGLGDYTVHGFRSSFRDWCGDETDFAREVAEAALAHTLEGKVEAAYRRGDAMAKRRALMDAWASFVTGAAGQAATAGDSVDARPRAA